MTSQNVNKGGFVHRTYYFFLLFFFTIASRKQVEEMLLLSFIHGFISEEEFGVLHEALNTKNPIFPHSDYARFTLDTLEESEIFAEFRVRKRCSGASRVIRLSPEDKSR